MDKKYNILFEHKMSKITIIKINKDILQKKLFSDNMQMEYYLLQIMKKPKKEYYLFKIGLKNLIIFVNK